MNGLRPVLRLARIQLRRGWMRAAVTGAAVAVGVATLVAADLISRSVTEDIARHAEAETLTAFISEQLNVGLTAIGWVISAGGGFLLFNTFAMAVAQRREDLGRLRAVGMTRAQAVALILAEALLVGAAGSAIGLLSGVVAARALVQLIQSTSEMMNALGRAPVSSERMLLAGSAGMMISLGAAAWPAWRAAQVPPLAALRPASAGGLETASRRTAGVCLLVCALLWAGLALASPGRWLGPPWSNVVTVACILVWLVCVGMSIPVFVGLVGRAARRPLTGLFGPAGRLAADNVRRARGRVTFTVITLAVGVAMVVGVTGYMSFWFDELFFRTAHRAFAENPGLGFFPLDVEAGLQAYQQSPVLQMPPGLTEEVEAAVAGRATVAPTAFVLSPELSFLGERYFSFILDFAAVRDSGGVFFEFSQGGWEQALAAAERGCAVLITPAVADKNDVDLYDELTLETPRGRQACTVAGIGPTFVGASIIDSGEAQAFAVEAPLAVMVFPSSTEDRAAIEPALQAIADRYPQVWLLDIRQITDMQHEAMESIRSLMSGMLLVAIVTAALGVVNTAVIGLSERRLEFGVLRAVGATRDHVQGIVILEGMLLGLVGAGVGVLAGSGLVMIFIVATGGSAFGFADFPVWEAGWASLGPALGRGLVALAAAPLLAGAAAWLPARRTLRGSVVETLAPRAEWF